MKSASWPPPRPNATANPGPAILDPRDTALPLARVTGWLLYIPPRAVQGVPAPPPPLRSGIGHEPHIQRLHRTVRHRTRVQGLRHAAVREGLDAARRQRTSAEFHCGVAYNRKKVEEYEEWLEMLPEKSEAEGTAPATIKVRTRGKPSHRGLRARLRCSSRLVCAGCCSCTRRATPAETSRGW